MFKKILEYAGLIIVAGVVVYCFIATGIWCYLMMFTNVYN